TPRGEGRGEPLRPSCDAAAPVRARPQEAGLQAERARTVADGWARGAGGEGTAAVRGGVNLTPRPPLRSGRGGADSRSHWGEMFISAGWLRQRPPPLPLRRGGPGG